MPAKRCGQACGSAVDTVINRTFPLSLLQPYYYYLRASTLLAVVSADVITGFSTAPCISRKLPSAISIVVHGPELLPELLLL